MSVSALLSHDFDRFHLSTCSFSLTIPPTHFLFHFKSTATWVRFIYNRKPLADLLLLFRTLHKTEWLNSSLLQRIMCCADEYFIFSSFYIINNYPVHSLDSFNPDLSPLKLIVPPHLWFIQSLKSPGLILKSVHLLRFIYNKLSLFFSRRINVIPLHKLSWNLSTSALSRRF